jgi:hypothetical protein
MKELLNRFIRSLTIYTAAIAAVAIAISFLNASLLTQFWPFLLLLFAGITLTLVTLLFSASEKKYSRFSNIFMIASMLKILLLIIIIGGYAFRFQPDAIRFSVTLLAFYILYLIFEIIWLLKLQKTDLKNGDPK